MAMKNKKLIIGLSVLGIIVLLIVLKKTGTIGSDSAVTVEVAKAAKRTIVETITASGKIKPQTEVKISPEVSGEIIEINVKEGQKVKEGDLLVKIKPDIYISALERAKASLNSAKANLANAQARLQQSKAQLIQAEKNYNRYKKLFEEKAVSEADFDNAETQYETQKADYEAAKQSLEGAKFSVMSAEASVNEAYENLKKTTIYAPMSGTVSKLNVEKGERVVGTAQMAGTELLTIADMDKMEVEVDVNENDIIRIKPGDTASIEVDAYLNHPFKGVVTEVANSSNNTGLSADKVTTFTVKILILKESYADLLEGKPEGFYPLRPGMSASVDIKTQVAKDVVAVPIEAVVTKTDSLDNDYEAVFAYDNGKVSEERVVTGIQDDNYIEIKKGLKEGQQVVTGPFEVLNKILKDGMSVTVSKTKNAGNE